jgi:HEAT repeat protein
VLALALAAACAESKDSRIAAIHEWASSGSSRAPGGVTAYLDDADRDVRIAALQALARVADPAAEQALVGALRDPDPSVRAAAVGGLATLGSTAHLAEIADLGLADADAAVRRRSARALAALGGEDAVAALMTALRDADAQVRLEAVRAVARLDPPAAVDPLAGMVLGDGDWEVRAEAAHVLGASGSSVALAALDAAAADPNEFVRAAASAAARQIRASATEIRNGEWGE